MTEEQQQSEFYWTEPESARSLLVRRSNKEIVAQVWRNFRSIWIFSGTGQSFLDIESAMHAAENRTLTKDELGRWDLYRAAPR